MSYHSPKPWSAFSARIQELRWGLLSCLEAILRHEATLYAGSDSFIYQPNNWTKYKLVPCDAEALPLSGLSAGEHARIEQSQPHGSFGRIAWHPDALIYQVGRARAFRAILFSVVETWEIRRPHLRDLAKVLVE